MKSFKQLQSFLYEDDKKDNKDKKSKDKDTKKKETSGGKPSERQGLVGSFITGFLAAGHKDIMGTARKYGYEPISHYVGVGKKHSDKS